MILGEKEHKKAVTQYTPTLQEFKAGETLGTAAEDHTLSRTYPLICTQDTFNTITFNSCYSSQRVS